MQLTELINAFEQDRMQKFESINQLLDYYQKKYIAGDIDVLSYRELYNYLHNQGATSSHEYAY